MRDFCYLLEGQGSVSLTNWLQQNGLKEEDCALVACRHSPSVYALFHDPSTPYRGLFSPKDDAALLCSSVSLEARPIAWMSCNLDAFKAHCREHREYWQWVSLRSQERYQTNLTHGQGYDSKNMMHTLRLLDMAIEIAQTGRLHVRRPNREWLLQVKQGEFEYEHLLELAEGKLEKIKQTYQNCNLPEEPDHNKILDLLYRVRKSFS